MWNLLLCVSYTGSWPAGRTEHLEAVRGASGALPLMTSVRPVISWGWWEGLGFHFCAFQKTHMRAPQRAPLGLHGFILRPTAGRLCETAVPAERGSCAFEEGTGACGCKPGRASVHATGPWRTPTPTPKGLNTPCFSRGNNRAGSCLGLNNQPLQVILGAKMFWLYIRDGNSAQESLGFPGGKSHFALMELQERKTNQTN